MATDNLRTQGRPEATIFRSSRHHHRTAFLLRSPWPYASPFHLAEACVALRCNLRPIPSRATGCQTPGSPFGRPLITGSANRTARVVSIGLARSRAAEFSARAPTAHSVENESALPALAQVAPAYARTEAQA